MRFIVLSLLMLFIVITPTSASAPTSWAYQLQSIDIEELKNSDYDWLVIDYSKEGDDNTAFSSSEITSIREGKSGRKILSYISIGEAEDYRYYWDENWLSNSPSWLDKENPDWEGNYKVQYWDSDWQDIILGYLDKIIDAGFDGVYLDIIDAYEYFDRSDASELMIDFVETIANHTRSQVNGFLIIPQNGEEIVNDRYLSIVDGIGREEVYVESHNNKRDPEETKVIESYLDKFIEAEKVVLTVDYADKDDLVSYAKDSATVKGYIPFVTLVELDVLGYENAPSIGFIDILFPVLLILGIRQYRYNKKRNL